MIDQSLLPAYRFFHDHGFVHRDGQVAYALACARAERWAKTTEGVELVVSPEEERYEDVYGKPPPKDAEFSCLSVVVNGETLASLGMVDDAGDYHRIVFAELCREAMASI
jgi:hypothetical protein